MIIRNNQNPGADRFSQVSFLHVFNQLNDNVVNLNCCLSPLQKSMDTFPQIISSHENDATMKFDSKQRMISLQDRVEPYVGSNRKEMIL